MGAATLADLIGHVSENFRAGYQSADRRLQWTALSIRPASRAAELREVHALYQRLQAVHATSPFADPELPRRMAVLAAADVFRATGAPAANDRLIEHVGASALQLLDEEIFFGFPAIDFAVPLSLEDCAALRAYLEDKRRFLLQPDRTLAAWGDGFVALWAALFRHLPDAAFQSDAESAERGLRLVRPLIAAASSPAAAIDHGVAAVLATGVDTPELFAALRRCVEDNVWTVTGVAPEARAATQRAPLWPRDCREPATELPELYLAGTPFAALFAEPVPLDVTKAHRLEHCHIVGGTGHGKTQLLQSLMLADFDDPERPAVVAIDSQGDMIRTLARLDRFNPSHDKRLIILDPADTAWPLRLNLFDVNRDRLAALPRGAQEQLLAGIIELYDYIFGALLGAELTQKQSVVFRFLAQAMLAIPGATIHTLRQLLEDPQPYWPHIESLPPTARTFLTEHLFATTKRGSKPGEYAATRAQVLRRLYGILSNPTFERLFSHPRNALDMKEALDQGRVILVNTAKDVLKAEASAIFGRYVIALVLKAALERAADAEARRRPAFVYIDEAADYFDDTIDTLLIQARKYKVGLTIAHQFLDQLTPGLKASVMSNPAVRLAGGLSAKDAAALKEDMRTTTEFLMSARKHRDATEFACFVRHLTPTALMHRVTLGAAERQPKMSETDFAALLARCRAEVAAPLAETEDYVANVGTKVEAGISASVSEEPAEFADSY